MVQEETASGVIGAGNAAADGGDTTEGAEDTRKPL